MKASLASFVSGLLFAVGLAIAGMTRPAKVVGFLDLAGAWDPSLAFVMVGAIAVYAVAHRVIMRRPTPLFDVRFHVPKRTDLDPRLLLGAAVFGVGWGLGGFCPGPGLASVVTGALPAPLFVLGMAGGILIEQRFRPSSEPAAGSARDHESDAG
jgi:uncharacterized membrane protein YedE/YeeE